MTTPTPAPAPMTAATLQQHRDDASDYKTPYSDGAAREAISDLLTHIDALTARVAELERREDELAEMVLAADNARVTQIRLREAAEAELAVARKVDDGEVAEAIKDLTCPEYASSRRNEIAVLLIRLSAALKKAEQRAKQNLDDYRDASEDLLAAEAKLESARRDALEERRNALEEAALLLDEKMGKPFGDEIRALQTKEDTTP